MVTGETGRAPGFMPKQFLISVMASLFQIKYRVSPDFFKTILENLMLINSH